MKGNAETTYRTGKVNITPANIGLGNVNNTADANKSVLYAASAGSAVDQTARNTANTALATSYATFHFSSTNFFSEYGNQVVYKIGRCVSIVLNFRIKQNVGKDGVICQIPNGYWPNWNVTNLAIIEIISGNGYAIRISTNGVVQANIPMPTGVYSLTYTYPGQL